MRNINIIISSAIPDQPIWSDEHVSIVFRAVHCIPNFLFIDVIANDKENPITDICFSDYILNNGLYKISEKTPLAEVAVASADANAKTYGIPYVRSFPREIVIKFHYTCSNEEYHSEPLNITLK